MYRWKFYSATAEVKHKSDCGGNKLCKVGNIYPSGGQNGNIYDINGISPTISSGETSTKGNGGVGSNNAPKIIVDDTNKIKVVGNYMPSNHDASRIVDTNGIAPTVKENHGTVTAVLVDDTYKNREPRLYDKYSPSIRAERQGFKVITNE